jgi:hypothetical protein
VPPPPPGAVDGATLDVGVVVDGVVLLLAGPLLPPPHPTANTSMAEPPKSATAFLAPDLISFPNLPSRHSYAVHFSVPPGAAPQTGRNAAAGRRRRMHGGFPDRPGRPRFVEPANPRFQTNLMNLHRSREFENQRGM